MAAIFEPSSRSRTTVAAGAAAALLTAALAAGVSAAPQASLGTPRQAMRVFIDSAREGDYQSAARALDLGDLPAGERAERGPRIARRLKFVLDQTLWVDWEKISDEPEGDPEDGARTELVGTVPLDGATIPIRLTRERGPQGEPVWRISSTTVAAVPNLYAEYGPGWIGEHLPQVLFRIRFLEVEAWQWLGLLVAALAALLVGWILAAPIYAIAMRVARRTPVAWDDALIEAAYHPVRLLFALLVFGIVTDALRLARPAQETIGQFLRVLFVVAFTWLGLRFVKLVADLLEARAAEETDEGVGRAARTQIMVLERVAWVVVVVFGGALVLMQFETMRTVGTSLLASAGVAGLVIGLAAQKSISSLLAGIQLSITQPIRIGDTVIVEGEWGWIEDITLTYVVVRVWDLRRLVVPITRFLDTPFQNWTKVSPELLGTVYLQADYLVPVDTVRAELKRLVEENPKWDRKAQGLIVTNVTDRTAELRALVSAKNSGDLWDLRCEVREGLLRFLQQLEGGRYVPRSRVELPEAEGGSRRTG